MTLYRAQAICVLALWGMAFGQSGDQADRRQTFHVEGIIVDALDARIPHVEVHFVGDDKDQTISADEIGFYQTDLPVGAYTMTAALRPSGPNRSSGLTKYTRHFHVLSAATITLNGYLNVAYYCDGVFAGEDPDAVHEGYKDLCGGDDSLPLPSSDAAPLHLDIQYARRQRGETLLSYSSNRMVNRPVLVSYNLFALQADSVEVDRTDEPIKAHGNVVMDDQSGRTSASSAAFKLVDGRAVRLW